MDIWYSILIVQVLKSIKFDIKNIAATLNIDNENLKLKTQDVLGTFVMCFLWGAKLFFMQGGGSQLKKMIYIKPCYSIRTVLVLLETFKHKKNKHFKILISKFSTW